MEAQKDESFEMVVQNGNKLIAQWLGFTYYPHNEDGVTEPGWKTTKDTSSIGKFNLTKDMFTPKDQRNGVERIFLARSHNGLQYHSSYDWLIPVYKHISELAHEHQSHVVYAEYVIMAESLRRGYDIIEVWKHAVECIKLLSTDEIKPVKRIHWETSNHLESKDSHWVLVNHDKKITLSYLPNKHYSRYNVTVHVTYDIFKELVKFIKKIS